jgi:glutamyl-tRNA synthetase
LADIDWTREAIMQALKSSATRHGLKPPQVMMAMRVLVAGTRSTPAIDAVLALLGRDPTRARMARGLGI